jgi:hypothetical protein
MLANERSVSPRGLVLNGGHATKERRIPAATERKRKARPAAVCGAAIFSAMLRKQRGPTALTGKRGEETDRPTAPAWLHWPSQFRAVLQTYPISPTEGCY